MEVGHIIDSFGMGKLQWGVVINSGFNRASVSMAIVMMSFLGPLVQCEWQMSSLSLAILNSAVPIGILIGSPILGFLGDKFGRKPMLVVASGMVAYFNLLSAFTTSVVWMFICRMCVGMGSGGLTLAAILASEFMPLQGRTLGLVILSSLWSVGVLLEFLLAYLTLSFIHWRTFIFIVAGFSIIPPMVSLILPESPRFLFLNNRTDEARDVLYRIAIANNKEPYKGEIVKPHTPAKQGNPMDMFHKNYRVTSILLFIMWIICGIITYGLLLVTATLPDLPHPCLQDPSTIKMTYNMLDTSCCRPLTQNTYFTLFLVAVAEIFSYPLTGFIIELVGRKWSLAICYFILSVLFIFFDFCVSGNTLTGLMMVAKLAAQTIFNVSSIYSVEVLPTSLRSVAVGICYAFSYVGSILSPFLAQMLLLKHTLGALLVFSFLCLLGGIISLMFPYETKGRRLRETVTDDVCLRPKGKAAQAAEEKREEITTEA
jgi:MFS family permease